MRPSLMLAAAAFAPFAPAALAAPAPAATVKIVSATQSDDGCAPGSHRDPAAVDKAGGDKAALANVPCVPDSSATQATAGTVDAAGVQPPGVKPLQVQPPGIKPAQVQPPGVKPAQVQPPGIKPK